ncbi:hypothetical protein HHI36_020876 [Cryptolaemus montrouzieri]|uniref:BZIP domain-containing protein n=1 Tax=Cryptolaemus montrouzieri TaxID=559131 RepID=A0ABD2NBY0_9CUCU
MSSGAKRFRYDSESFQNSSDESEDTNSNETQNDDENGIDIKVRRYQSRQKPKCYSKNAQMARENRLKKKIYLAKLEKEVEYLRKDNSKLSNIIEHQSFSLNELKREVKYLKGVLANSSDITKLLKSINHNTGMCVSTSLKDIKDVVPISRKTMHPWEQSCSSTSPLSQDFTNDVYTDIETEFQFGENDLSPFLMDETDMPLRLELEETIAPHEEHSYTRDVALSRTLGELQIYLPMYRRLKSLRYLVDEIQVGKDEYCKKMYRSFFS